MARPIVLSNNQIFVGLDEFGLVNDFYFPYVGLDNLITERNCHHKIGIFINNQFSWVNDGQWQINLEYIKDSLVSRITMENENLKVRLTFNDYTDPDFNSFIRHVVIDNLSDQAQSIKIFFHQVFVLSNEGRGDTAMYVPSGNYIYNYRDKKSLIISGKFEDGKSFDQYSTGNYHIEGKIGTYVDAEDGELSNNPIEHASVDSTIRFSKTVEANNQIQLDYWVIANQKKENAEKIHYNYLFNSIESRLDYTIHYWKKWLENSNLSDFKYKSDVTKNLLIIKAHCDQDGSIIASGDSSILNYGRDYYAYCWPRDAFFALGPLLKLGFNNEAKQFLRFCIDTITVHGYMQHKYLSDKAIGSTWHPLINNNQPNLAIQEDETAVVLILIRNYFKLNSDKNFLEECYKKLVIPAANFMASFIDPETGLPHPSYDLWEEKFLTSTYTVSCVIEGLRSAIEVALMVGDTNYSHWQDALDQIIKNFNLLYDETNGYFIKGILIDQNHQIQRDTTLDISSLIGPFIFNVLKTDSKEMLSTLKQVEVNLKNTSPAGGVIRYVNDKYFLKNNQFKGNPWIVCTLWLAKYYLAVNKINEAKQLIDWSKSLMRPTGAVSEQFDALTRQEIGVNPLVWSESSFVDIFLSLK